MKARSSRLRIVLVAPRIAANVGNAARTAEALGAELHLVGPFGFFIDEKKLKRSSVGYWERLRPKIFTDGKHFWSEFEKSVDTQIFWATKRGDFVYTDCVFNQDICLIFGNEEEGVPAEFWVEKHPSINNLRSCRIPMRNIRCLNLATSVGVIGYEVLRQWNLRTRTICTPIFSSTNNTKAGLEQTL